MFKNQLASKLRTTSLATGNYLIADEFLPTELLFSPFRHTGSPACNALLPVMELWVK
jgi:hypothetical protein